MHFMKRFGFRKSVMDHGQLSLFSMASLGISGDFWRSVRFCLVFLASTCTAAKLRRTDDKKHYCCMAVGRACDPYDCSEGLEEWSAIPDDRSGDRRESDPSDQTWRNRLCLFWSGRLPHIF